jgi:hypothetical protein
VRRIIGIIFDKGRIGDLPPTDRGVGIVGQLRDLHINCPDLATEDNGGQEADHENSYIEQTPFQKMTMHNKPACDIAAISCNLTAKNQIQRPLKTPKLLHISKKKQDKQGADYEAETLLTFFGLKSVVIWQQKEKGQAQLPNPLKIPGAPRATRLPDLLIIYPLHIYNAFHLTSLREGVH